MKIEKTWEAKVTAEKTVIVTQMPENVTLTFNDWQVGMLIVTSINEKYYKGEIKRLMDRVEELETLLKQTAKNI